MEPFFVVSNILVFIVDLFIYLSFSVASHEAIYSRRMPLERTEEEYRLEPFTKLSSQPESLLVLFYFAQMLFAAPLFILVYRWTLQSQIPVIVLSFVALTVLLYLLPLQLHSTVPRTVFRRTVQTIGFLLYPLFWLMMKVVPLVIQETQEEAKKGSPEDEEQEESREFKGDILKAISVIEETMVREVMTPRVEMVCVSSEASLEELHQLFKENKFSRLPVFQEKVDNILGVVNLIDLVSTITNGSRSAPVRAIMRPALFVPETKKVFTLLREFRESHAQMAIVVDEYGGTSGLVTLEDLLEEIVGDIEDEYDEVQVEVYQEKEGTYVVTGKLPVERLEETFHTEVNAEDFETISGLVFSLLGRIPVVGEIVKYRNLHLEILEADKRRIHRIRIRQMEQNNAEETL